MSLLINRSFHKVYDTPARFIGAASTQGNPTSDTYTITPGVTATEGNLLVAIIGGAQSRGFNTIPSGWTHLVSIGGGRTCSLFYKVAGAGEPASYDWVLTASLTGGYWYAEITNLDTTNPILLHIGAAGGPVTTLSPGTFDVTEPCFALTYLSLASTATWNTDNGFTSSSPAGSFKFGGKFFNSVELSQTVNWSGASNTVTAELVLLRVRKV